MDNRVLEAMKIAATAHEGQKDKGGKPYILHPLTVAENVYTDDERILAILHDVVEDTDVTLEDVRVQFGDSIADALDCLTHRVGEDYDSYIDRVMTNSLAVDVKLADLKNNMDLSRIESPGVKDFARLKKYERARDRLLNQKYKTA